MKLRLLPLLLAGAATAGLAEDCPLVLNQRFQLHYNQWQISQIPTAASTQAVYEVDAMLPVVTYRLGALSLSGALEYNRLAYGAEAESQTGLSRYGARLNLFPYRPFRVYLDYQHSQSPDLFGSGRVLGDTWGGGISYGSRFLQDVRLTYRHGLSKLEDLRDEWSLWKFDANQQIGNTKLQLQGTRQEFQTFGAEKGWRLFIANLESESHIGNNWILRTRSQVQDNQYSRWTDLSATFYGPISGALHSLTTLSGGGTTIGEDRTSNSFGSESLVLSTSHWTLHTSGAFSRSDTKSLGQAVHVGSVAVGSQYSLNQDWRFHTDFAVSKVQQTFTPLDLSRTTSTVNVGFARGGDVPELIRHSLFFISDWSFRRRVQDEYPPDFVPTELAQDMLRRRLRQTGSFGFTADFWRMSDSVTQGKLDWARVTGQVQTRGNFTLYLSGDFKHDAEMSQPGLDTRISDLVANSSYQMGATSLTGSLGYSSSQQKAVPGTAIPVPSVPFAAQDGLSRYSSLGIATRILKVPVGVMVFRYDPPMTSPTTTVSTWADLSFRQVSLRVRYETSRMNNGIHSSRFTLDLLRWFDTVCVGKWR